MLLGARFLKGSYQFEEYAKGNPHDCMSVMVDDKPELCEKYSIDYYPTVLVFKKGEVHKRLDATPFSK